MGKLSWVRDLRPSAPPDGGGATRPAPDERGVDAVAILVDGRPEARAEPRPEAAAPRLPSGPVFESANSADLQPVDPDELRGRVAEALALLRVGPTSRGRRSARNRVDHALEVARRELGRAARILGPPPPPPFVVG